MSDKDAPVTEDELQAYVDGELAAERHNAVDAWLMGHPEEAARVAAWRAQAEAIRARYSAIASEPVPSGERFTIYDAPTDSPATAMRYRAAERFAALYWVEQGLAYVVCGPVDRERLLRVAQAAYDQIDKGKP